VCPADGRIEATSKVGESFVCARAVVAAANRARSTTDERREREDTSDLLVVVRLKPDTTSTVDCTHETGMGLQTFQGIGEWRLYPGESTGSV
jgi:hypothetical protein